MSGNFEKNVKELAKELRKAGKKRFVLQLPEGLKVRAVDIIAALENEGFKIIYAANPCYGACDLAADEMKSSGADALIHVGHSKFYVDIKADFPVIYFPWKIDFAFPHLDFSVVKEEKIGIMTTVQHMELLEEAAKEMEKQGKTAVIGGQILGCNTAAAKRIEKEVDAFVFIGSGKFHPLAMAGKKTYVLDIETGKIELLDSGRAEKRRWASIYKARDARSFGILVSTKMGQKELLGKADEIKKRLEKARRKAVIIMMDEITDQKLQGIRVDAFINTACPRLTDDSFSKPVINAADLEEVLEE